MLRFWEHEDPEAVADQVQQAVQAALLDQQDDDSCEPLEVSQLRVGTVKRP